MDPITAIGLAAAVAQFVTLGVKVARKLDEYSQASQGDTPKSLQGINTRLPLLVSSLSRVQSEAESSRYDSEERSILYGVVLGCQKLVQELDEVGNKIRPKPGESLASKWKKVLISLKSDERIEEINQALQAYIQILILHRVVDRADVQVAVAEDPPIFVVREQKVADWIPRDKLLLQIDKLFHDATRGLNRSPDFVVLTGEEGVGKSQIALAYCQQTWDGGRFPTVLWSDASTPASLITGLEIITAVIQRTKAGTTEEKLKFLNTYLTERWHPWLLVLDNYHDDKFADRPLSQLLPAKGNGAVLITTRSTEGKTLGDVVHVPKFMTPGQESTLRFDVTQALLTKKLQPLTDALSRGLDVDSCSRTGYHEKSVPLINVAAEAGFDEAVQLLLDRGANPHPDPAKGSLLLYAVRSKCLSTVLLYLEHEDRTGQLAAENQYYYAFQTTIEDGDVTTLQTLLQRRERQFHQNESRIIYGGFERAIASGHLEVLQLVHSMNKFPQAGWMRADLLGVAVERKQLDITRFLVCEVGVDVNTVGNHGRPALYRAVNAYSSNLSDHLRDTFVSLLLANGASPNVQAGPYNRTPLHLAATLGSVSTTALLLENGADVAIEDNNQQTPLLLAMNQYPALYPMLTDVGIARLEMRERYFVRAMFAAIRKGDRELVLLLAKKGYSNVVQDDSGMTPLLSAIMESQTPTARLLIRNGAKQSVCSGDGSKPLTVAAQNGLDLVIRDLLKAADSAGPDPRDEKGNTPLILAARGNHVKAVEVLLTLGADKEAVNDFGETALDVAEEESFEDIIRLLQK